LKFDQRLQIVRYADEHGIKPAVEHFAVTRKTVRTWLRRWRADNRAPRSLQDRSRAPKTCPHKTSRKIEQMILQARKEAPCLGAHRLKDFCQIPASVGAISRILRQHNLTRRRKKKYQKKRDMREAKARFNPFEENQVDVKYLNDIPFYVKQMWRNPDLPRFQYTWRDVKTGGLFLGFANELSQAHACCFIAAIGAHLARVGFSLRDCGVIQTDNGSEFSGAERRRDNDRGFSHVARELLGARHRFIPPGKKNYQADVETSHDRIEEEFFNLEACHTRRCFFAKTNLWQLWWNTTRTNTYKHRRTPDQILLEELPRRDPHVWTLPALDLDDLLRRRTETMLKHNLKSGGYHVPVAPETWLGWGRRRLSRNRTSAFVVRPSGRIRSPFSSSNRQDTT